MSHLRVAVVVSRWNEVVTSALCEGALRTLKERGILKENIEVVHVPGCFELPLAAKQLAELKTFDALVCLGAVIQGETMHHEQIANAATLGIEQVSRDFTLPIGFGVLTTQNLDLALERSGGKMGNKGSEAAQAALDMALLLQTLKQKY